MSKPFDPDETQDMHPLRLPPSPTMVVALDADAEENSGLVDGYTRSAVVVSILITERGRVHLTGVDWGQFPVTPGRYQVYIELDPV